MALYLQELMYLTSTSYEIKPIVAIDNAQSVIWVRRYDTPGEFEVYVPADKEIFKLIKNNIGYLIVTREDSSEVMYVEYVKLTESEENGDYILIKGRSIDCIMERRVIGYPTKYSHYPRAVVIGNLIRENMISPEPHEGYQLDALHRTISPFVFDRGAFTGENIECSYNGENLLEKVGELLKDGGYGLRTALISGTINFQLYQGQDRPHVVFSPYNENLISSEYECDIRGQCNTAFIYAEGDEEHIKPNGSNPYTVTRQYPASLDQRSGYARYESFMTASADTIVTESDSLTEWEPYDVSYQGVPDSIIYAHDVPSGKKISVTWELSIADDSDVRYKLVYYDTYDDEISYTWKNTKGSTVIPPANTEYFKVILYRNTGYQLEPEDVVSVTVTALRDRQLADYKNAIAEQGAALMLGKSDRISGETVETGLYKIGTDYDLGDTVRVENSYGVKGTAKVAEITERWDSEGYHIYPTFTDWTVT